MSDGFPAQGAQPLAGQQPSMIAAEPGPPARWRSEALERAAPLQATFAAYFAALAAADASEAVAVLDAAERAGVSRAELVRHVIVPAQATVGTQWLQGVWGVADEHAATGVAERTLAMTAPRESFREAAHVVWMVCAEGEWHSFPPRLAAELAQGSQLRIIAFGASMAGDHLQRHLSQSQPDALGLSVTMTVNLISAARSIRVAHEAGVPVIAGGAAWGVGQHRARKLGAQLFLDDPAALPAAVAGLAAPSDTDDLPTIPGEVLLLDRAPAELLQAAYEAQCKGSVWMQRMDHLQQQRTLEDFGWMARHAAAAVLCDDARIVGDLFDWLLTLLTPRGVPGNVVLDSALYLADAVEQAAPRAAGMLREEALAAKSALNATAEAPRVR